ncbi:MAG: hypothetical protein EPN97_14755 [Alphaproteobacteria bacterium]|nr:MAG: hypothetical protein EPN97_14755 [Alphaproteobacteria bacterium]
MAKTPTLKAFEAAVWNSLLDRLSKVPEGRELVDYARRHKVKFEFASMSGGEWVPQQNKVKLGRSIPPDQALGALAHELRHMWQSSEVKGLDRTHSKTKGDPLHKITLLRGMEADAFSYQLAMLVELQKLKIIKSVEDAMMDKGNPIGAHTLKEVRGFAREFARKHKDKPFSPKARGEAFRFFHGSDYFREWYDGLYAEHFAGRRPGKGGAGLPGLSKTFNTFAQVRVTGAAEKYLSPAEIAGIGTSTLRQLEPSLRRIIAPKTA